MAPATYTCDSQALDTAEHAETAQAATCMTSRRVWAKLWSEAGDRSSPRHVVLHMRAARSRSR